MLCFVTKNADEIGVRVDAQTPEEAVDRCAPKLALLAGETAVVRWNVQFYDGSRTRWRYALSREVTIPEAESSDETAPTATQDPPASPPAAPEPPAELVPPVEPPAAPEPPAELAPPAAPPTAPEGPRSPPTA